MGAPVESRVVASSMRGGGSGRASEPSKRVSPRARRGVGPVHRHRGVLGAHALPRPGNYHARARGRSDRGAVGGERGDTEASGGRGRVRGHGCSVTGHGRWTRGQYTLPRWILPRLGPRATGPGGAVGEDALPVVQPRTRFPTRVRPGGFPNALGLGQVRAMVPDVQDMATPAGGALHRVRLLREAVRPSLRRRR